jgi:beta-glucanase (GH16 family)
MVAARSSLSLACLSILVPIVLLLPRTSVSLMAPALRSTLMPWSFQSGAVAGLGAPSNAGLRTGERLAAPGRLLWSDNFSLPGLPDSSKWGYDMGKGFNGWGNREWQTYTDDAAHVTEGRLTIPITFYPERNLYTSARMVTRDKFSFRYGRVDVRAKVATTHGSWSAAWMLPTNSKLGWWPHIGEIDIMEHVGMDPGVVHGTVHTGAYNHMRNTQKGRQVRPGSVGQEWHTYSIVWTPDHIVWAVNDKVYNRFENDRAGDTTTWPFDQYFHIILNLAVGGDWGGQKGVDYETMKQGARNAKNVMEVDFVRVYEA